MPSSRAGCVPGGTIVLCQKITEWSRKIPSFRKKRALHPGLTRVSNFISGYNHSAQKLSVFINYLKFKVPAANVNNRTTK